MMAPAARPPMTPAATAPLRLRALASPIDATTIVATATSAIIAFLMEVSLLNASGPTPTAGYATWSHRMGAVIYGIFNGGIVADNDRKPDVLRNQNVGLTERQFSFVG